MNNGIKTEFMFIKEINKRKVKELNPLMQEIIEKLFDKVNENDIVYARKYGLYAKSDIVITINNIDKGLSIKSGSRNSIHLENINNFFKKVDIKNKTILLKYLYSDGTSNNTGMNRKSTSEYKDKHIEEINIINKELSNKNISKNLITRFLIEVDIKYKVQPEIFILGEPNDFIYATKEEVINYLIENIDYKSTSVHTSKLFIQLWNKNINRNNKYEHCRNYIQVKWYSMFDDIIKIMNERYKKQE